MSERWSEIPFKHHFINKKIDNGICRIPFVIGGATQQGTVHILDNSNNQDAISICIEDDLIIGIVCDGCTSTHDDLINSYSNNEIGSKLIAHTLSNILRSQLSESKIIDETFLEVVAKKLFDHLKSLISIMSLEGEKEKEIFIFDYLMTTILCFIVTENSFIVFNCGDGIIGLNNIFQLIDENGLYFSSSLLPECCPSLYSKPIRTNKFNIIYSGNTNELQSILLATDGFDDIAQKYQTKLSSFIIDTLPKSKNGFDFVLPDFRQFILRDKDISNYSTSFNWPKDDASFLVLRRIIENNKFKSSDNIIKGIEDDTNNKH